jgi:hypothetical protein
VFVVVEIDAFAPVITFAVLLNIYAFPNSIQVPEGSAVILAASFAVPDAVPDVAVTTPSNFWPTYPVAGALPSVRPMRLAEDIG